MKTIMRKYRVYRFSELKSESQDKAIDQFSYINVENGWWHENDYLLDSLLPKKILIKLKLSMLETGRKPDTLFKWEDMYFDLDRGAYLDFKHLEVTNDDVFRQFLKLPQKLWTEIEWSFDTSHERSSSIIRLEFWGDKADDPRLERAEAIFDQLIKDALASLRLNYEHATSREAVVETIEANDYQFLADGTVFQ